MLLLCNERMQRLSNEGLSDATSFPACDVALRNAVILQRDVGLPAELLHTLTCIFTLTGGFSGHPSGEGDTPTGVFEPSRGEPELGGLAPVGGCRVP